MSFRPPWKKLKPIQRDIVVDELGNVIKGGLTGYPTPMHGYFLGQEREMIVAGKGHYREGQYIDDHSNGLLKGVVELVKPHRNDTNSFLEEVWIYRPWLDV